MKPKNKPTSSSGSAALLLKELNSSVALKSGDVFNDGESHKNVIVESAQIVPNPYKKDDSGKGKPQLKLKYEEYTKSHYLAYQNTIGLLNEFGDQIVEIEDLMGENLVLSTEEYEIEGEKKVGLRANRPSPES